MCASQGPVAANAADSQAASNYLRKSATAKETVDVDKQSVGDLTGAADLWDRIRRGFQMPDLEGPGRHRRQWTRSGPTTCSA
jgi:membrane-bound lytic murein transglycosylase D